MSKLSIYFYLVYSLLPEHLTSIQNLFIITSADVVPCGGRKSLTVHHYSANYIIIVQIIFSGPYFGIIRFILSTCNFEKRITA